ncbi:glycoprotein-N-acetylgalactosamine 3-beta-galactosyltransferase 1-like [Gigantopelta aegis]|uniref:glycoprotein-N-acetylgalactosamine 3-beta-galactosyltransferase 1-like n=1 Tax=Gigantopelta aegis TaxID=1735272 RepID=UPI001B88E656|nr:glycoprotein-N-acetylgalactosamine 3-beta-galactosyltransferase 1-like [Gigantopelta aegis]
MKWKPGCLVSAILHLLAGVVFGVSIGLVFLANEPQSPASLDGDTHRRLVQSLFRPQSKDTKVLHPGDDIFDGTTNTTANTKKSDSNWRNVSIVCWLFIKHAHAFLKTSRLVNNTWGRKCNKIVFFLEHYNASLPAVGLNKELIDGRLNYSSSIIVLGFRYIFQKYINDADWFIGIIGSQYIIMENLRHFLSKLDPNHPAYYGHKLGSSAGGTVFASPQSGIVLSKAGLGLLGNEGHKGLQCNNFPYGEGEQFAMCMNWIGVSLMDTVDESGKSRFLVASLSEQFQPQYEAFICRSPIWKDLEPQSCKQPAQAVSRELISFSEYMPWYYPGYEYFIYSLKYVQP